MDDSHTLPRIWLALYLMLICLPLSAQEKPVSSFTLLKGEELPVCNAYVTRLRETSFYVDRYCDRSGGADSTPGFTKLEYVPLSSDEILRLYAPVVGFLQWGDEKYYERFPGTLRDGVPTFMLDAKEDAKLQEKAARDPFFANHPENWPKFFRYRPAVDIDNDGLVDDVIAWRQTGAACGVISGPTDVPARASTRLVFLDAHGKFDPERTTSAFGKDPTPIGRSLGVFKYGKDYYFDSFYTAANARARTLGVKAIADVLAVYRRNDGANELQCEIQWNRAFTRNGED